MAYKNKTSFTIAFDSSSPHTAMDALIDFIANRIIADVPEISVQHEIAYDADSYKNFPVFSGLNASGGFVPASKIVFLGKNSNSLGLMLMCYLNGSTYYLSIRVMLSFDMLCVTPATYGDNYKSVANACKYIYYQMRGYTFDTEIDQKFNITPGTDNNNMYISIIAAVGKHACAYCINSGRTSFENYRLAFIRDNDDSLKSLWWENGGYSVFDIDYKFPLKAGYFSPSKYNQEVDYHRISDNLSLLDNKDVVFSRLILLAWRSDLFNSACGLKIFTLGFSSRNYSFNGLSLKTPFVENLSNKINSYTLWTNEFFPGNVKENQIFLRQMVQPITSETFIHLYRMAINSQTTPKAGNVYKTSQGVFMSLTPYVVGYAVKLTD